MKGWLRRDGLVLAVYLGLAVVLTYPLALHLDTHVPGRGVDDPALTWNLWWVKYSIFDLGISPLYSNYIYYPIGVNLVAYTATFLNGVLSLPLQFNLGVIVANNLYIYAALALAGYGAFLLAREVMARLGPGSDLAAAVAGTFYALGAWHISYVAAGHMMLLSNQWIPFYALYLLRLGRGRGRSGLLAGLFFACCAWTELTFIPFIALLTAAYLLYLLLARRDLLKVRAFWVNLLALGAVTVLLLAPLGYSLLLDTLRYGYYLAPGLGRVQIFSAEPISFFVPSFMHPLLGAWADEITNANTSYAFVGYAPLILSGFGLWLGRRASAAWFWALLASFVALVLLGPTLIVNGTATSIPLPFALLRMLPFVNANRYPVRFNVMLMLALSPLMALGVVYLRRHSRGAVMLSGLLALFAFEQLVLPIPISDLTGPPVLQTIRAEEGDFTVLDLPLGWRNSVAIQGKIDFKAQFLQTIHQKRLLGGLTSRNPLFKYQYYLELPVINSLIALENGQELDAERVELDRAAAADVLRFFDIRYIVAQSELTDPGVLDYVRTLWPLQEIGRDGTRVVYRVTHPPDRRGQVDVGSEAARLYFDDQWGRPQVSAQGQGYRWATSSTPQLWLPLSRADSVVSFRLRGAAPGQRLALSIAGQRVADWTLSPDWTDYDVTLPATILRDGLAEFDFVSDTWPLAAVTGEAYAIGATGVTAPVDIAVTGAGYNAGRFGEIVIAGRNVIPSRRGFHLAAVNPRTGAAAAVGSFDTSAGASDSAQLARFITAQPDGEIIAGAAVDDVLGKLGPEAFAALAKLGLPPNQEWEFRTGYAFIGVKGARPGTALLQADDRFPANVSVGKNVSTDHVAFALARISFGPAETR